MYIEESITQSLRNEGHSVNVSPVFVSDRFIRHEVNSPMTWKACQSSTKHNTNIGKS